MAANGEAGVFVYRASEERRNELAEVQAYAVETRFLIYGRDEDRIYRECTPIKEEDIHRMMGPFARPNDGNINVHPSGDALNVHIDGAELVLRRGIELLGRSYSAYMCVSGTREFCFFASPPHLKRAIECLASRGQAFPLDQDTAELLEERMGTRAANIGGRTNALKEGASHDLLASDLLEPTWITVNTGDLVVFRDDMPHGTWGDGFSIVAVAFGTIDPMKSSCFGRSTATVRGCMRSEFVPVSFHPL
jgi:hypothetical protein